MAFWSAKLESRWNEVAARLVIRGRGLGRAEIVTLCNSGPKRSGNENYKILAIQRSLYHREPTFISGDEMRAIRRSIKEAFTSGAVNAVGGMRRLAEAIGQKMIRLYRLHIAAGVSKSGTMKSLANSTRTAKIRKGTVSKPILVDTGEMRDSLTFRVDLKN